MDNQLRQDYVGQEPFRYRENVSSMNNPTSGGRFTTPGQAGRAGEKRRAAQNVRTRVNLSMDDSARHKSNRRLTQIVADLG